MQRPLFRNRLTVQKSIIHGYGVFADQTIEAGDMIEECYALGYESKQGSIFSNYLFQVDSKNVLLLGNGSLYNHADDPNCHYEFDPNESLMVFRATQRIRHGEEIFISYGSSWFESRRAKAKSPTWRYRWRRARPMMSAFLRFSFVTLAIFGLLDYLHR
jgi:hypothetical protein